jgi:hypothetical protein
MISYFSKLSRFERQITKLRGDRFWAFSKEWDNAISIAIANKNGDYLEELYHCLKDASDRTPEEFPLWYLLPVPREVETLFASKTTKSDCYALHNSLRAMSSDEQEEVVKS